MMKVFNYFMVLKLLEFDFDTDKIWDVMGTLSYF